jgi:hypothetical protein
MAENRSLRYKLTDLVAGGATSLSPLFLETLFSIVQHALHVCAVLMQERPGYERWVAQGDDWSSATTHDEIFQTPALRHLATSLKSRQDDALIEVKDTAYWMKGCSSLGLLHFAVARDWRAQKKTQLLGVSFRGHEVLRKPAHRQTRVGRWAAPGGWHKS